LDRHEGEEPVDVVHGQEEGLRVQAVLLCHLYQPVDQDGSHGEGDVGLLRHVVPLGKILALQLKSSYLIRKMVFPLLSFGC
jgi:hypothetical protein